MLEGENYRPAKQFWPTPTAQGRWAGERQITQLRLLVDQGVLTVEEAEAMIEGSINPPRMARWPTPTARDYKDTGKKEALAKYSHKKRLACSVAHEDIMSGGANPISPGSKETD